MKEVWFFLEEDMNYSNFYPARIGDFSSFEEAWEVYQKHLSWGRKPITPVMTGYVKG